MAVPEVAHHHSGRRLRAIRDDARGDGRRSGSGRVRLDGVTKRFGDVDAVRDLVLEVPDREFLVLLGPSGCGKSTVLRLIAGLEDPTAGSITIGDELVNDVEAVDRDVAMVFQTYALYPHLTVGRNIEFPLRSRGISTADRRSRVVEVAQALGLEDLLGRKPAQLSGGQRQRVALARAIVRRPLVFLMDEPLSNLDAKLRVQTRAELVDLRKRLATTVIYVTHDQVEAMTMGDRIAVMQDGELQQVGPPQDVYNRPANLFVAQFIGSPPMNLVPGRVRTEPVVEIEMESGRVAFPGTTVDAGREVVLGFRPEHCRLGTDGLVGEVLLVESLGHERHLLCRLEGGHAVVVRFPADGPAPPLGHRVTLDVPAGGLHLFDPISGKRLDD